MTDLSDFTDTIRLILGDLADVKRYSAGNVVLAVKSAVRLNKITGYALTAGLDGITPEVTDPNTWALICYHAAKLLKEPVAGAYAYKRRAMGESFGDSYQFLATLGTEIHRLENGSMFSSWQSFQSFAEGMSGLKFEEEWTEATIRRSVFQVPIA